MSDQSTNSPEARSGGRFGWLESERLRGIGVVATALAAIATFIVLAAPAINDWLSDDPKNLRIVLALDRSSSMNCPVEEFMDPCPDEDGRLPDELPELSARRIGAAVDGASEALSWFGHGDKLGVWSFADTVTRGFIAPVSRPRVERKVRSIAQEVGSGTWLYLAIYHGVKTLRTNWQEDALNALVLLTDGKDHTSFLDGRRLDDQRLDDELGDDDGKTVHVLLTPAWDVSCKQLFPSKITAFELQCFPITAESDARAAFEDIEQHLNALAGK